MALHGQGGAGRRALCARAGGARCGEGVVAPVGEEIFEALDGADEVDIDADEEFGVCAVFGRNWGDDGLEAGEDGSEEGGEGAHCGDL